MKPDSEPNAVDANTPAVSGGPCKVGDRANCDVEHLEALSRAVTTVVDALAPAVVSINVKFAARPGRHPAGEGGGGSGVVIAPDGYIVTNSHVVLGAREISIEFMDGTVRPASLVGADQPTDLAALRVDASGLAFGELGDSKLLRPGQMIIAMGNPLGFDSTVSTGVVSALGRALRSQDGRSIEDVIQHTAPLNPGNSGGPLLNVRGQIVGINTAIIAAAQGIGFAVPSSTANWVLAKLMTQGRVDRGYLGIVGGTRPLHRRIVRFYTLPADNGVLVVAVDDRGPAKLAGLLPNDVIVRIGDRTVTSVDDLHRFLTEWPTKKAVVATVIRGTEKLEVSITPAAAP